MVIKDLLSAYDSKTQSTMGEFLMQTLKYHPEFLELQGNRIFKSILRNKYQADQKLKVVFYIIKFLADEFIYF